MSDETTKKTATINTVQRAVYIARLAIPRYRNYSWYIPYDVDNLYPNKAKSIAERSVTTMTAIETHSDFLSGQGFGDDLNKEIVNREGQTLEEVLQEKTTDFSTFKGMALHFNYNRGGQIVEINEIIFEGLRWNKDMSKLLFAEDWSQITTPSKQVTEYDPFNPDNVINEINRDGIEKYKGQVIYFIPKSRDIYTVARFDSAINDSQFEDESSVHKLSSIQNDYALGGLMKLPAPLFDEDEETGIVKTIKGKKGSQGAGSWFLVPVTNEETFKGKLFEPMARQNIDGFFKTQNETAKSNIYEAYQQPPILSGKSFGGMFNQDQFADAFDYYNSKTAKERSKVEKFFNRFWGFTIWSKGETLEIIPNDYIIKREGSGEILSDDPDEAEKEALKIKAEAQAKLKGTASGTESLLAIKQSIVDGVTDYGSALALLDEIYGFNEETARRILGKEKK